MTNPNKIDSGRDGRKSGISPNNNATVAASRSKKPSAKKDNRNILMVVRKSENYFRRLIDEKIIDGFPMDLQKLIGIITPELQREFSNLILVNEEKDIVSAFHPHKMLLEEYCGSAKKINIKTIFVSLAMIMLCAPLLNNTHTTDRAIAKMVGAGLIISSSAAAQLRPSQSTIALGFGVYNALPTSATPQKQEEKETHPFNVGVSYFQSDQFDKAIEHFQEAVKLEPDNAHYQHWLGTSYFKSDQFDKAIEYFQKAVKLEPVNAKHLDWLGTSYFQSNKFEKAIEHFQKEVELEPDNAHYQHWLGTSYFQSDKFDKAIEHFQEAAKLEPVNARYQNWLGTSYFQSYKFDKAIEHFQEAVKLEPDNAHYQNWFG